MYPNYYQFYFKLCVCHRCMLFGLSQPPKVSKIVNNSIHKDSFTLRWQLQNKWVFSSFSFVMELVLHPIVTAMDWIGKNIGIMVCGVHTVIAMANIKVVAAITVWTNLNSFIKYVQMYKYQAFSQFKTKCSCTFYEHRTQPKRKITFSR